MKLKKKEILLARNWCFHNFNFKHFIPHKLHQAGKYISSVCAFSKVGLCTFCHSRLSKVFWLCLTKVSGKNQSFTNKCWFSKYLIRGIKSCKKPKWQDTQKSRKIKNYKNHKIGKLVIFKCKKSLDLSTPLYCEFSCCTD